MSTLRLTAAQRRVLASAAKHRDGRVLASALPSDTIDKLSRAGLIERDGFWDRGPLWRITAAGREAVASQAK